MGGEHYTHSGGAANYLCLPKVPKYDQYKDGVQHGGLMYGTEYQLSFNPFDKTLQDHNAACAVCYVESRGSMLMMPIVHPDGPRSIMGTWWLNITPTRVKKNSSVLTETRSTSLEPRRTRMVPCSTLLKGRVEAICRVVHMFQVESWLALCVPSERKTGHFCIMLNEQALRKNAVD